MVAEKRKYLTLSTVLTLAVFAAFVLCLLYPYHYFRNISKRMACSSYLSSMAACLQENQKIETMAEITRNIDKEWRFLNEQEYVKLASILSKSSHSLDLGGVSPSPDRILFDHWNQRILIAGRKLPGKDPEFILWSKGPDKVFRTKDDIAAPWNEPVPDGLKE